MSKKKKGQPRSVRITDQLHTLNVLHILERHEDGRPKTFRVVYQDEKVKLSEDKNKNCFVFAYIRPVNFIPEGM